MNIKKLLFLPLLLVGMLASCNQAPSSQETYPEIDFPTSDYICEGGSYGGFFTEVNAGRKLCSESTYEFVFSSSYTVDTSYTVSISVPQLATFDKKSKTKFNIVTTKAIGDFILKIENAQGLIVYRNVVRVRKAFEADKMGQALYNIDRFVSDPTYERWYGSWRMMFTQDDPISGSISGGDDLEQNVNITFELTFQEYDSNTDTYVFNVTEKSSTASQTSIVGMLITRCADYIYVYEDSGLLTMLTASN